MIRLGSALAVFALAFLLAVWALHVPQPYTGPSYSPPPAYAYPSPSWWPSGPVPAGHPRPQPSSSAACPPWAPFLVIHPNGVQECQAPPHPRTYITNPCPDPSEIVSQGPDGTLYCRAKP